MKTMKARRSAPGNARQFAAQAFVLVFILSSSACFSFRVAVPTDPEGVVGALAIVHSQPGDLDLEKPLVDESVSDEDTAIHFLVKVLQVNRPMLLQWHWYSPENLRVYSSKTVTVNAKARYLTYFAAWDTLPRTYYAGKKGNWAVVLTADGRFFARKEFSIK